jgi:phosphoribosylamine--glycine ligase
MNVLVLGSGGREHALVWKIKQSPKVKAVYCIPGNAGIASMAECVDIKISDFNAIGDFAVNKNIDITIVGPEVPLAEGVVDYFDNRGLKIFGPNKAGAQLEASKVFSKHVMKKYGIPTAEYDVFTDSASAVKHINSHLDTCPLVVKADGLAAGKGVLVCMSKGQALAAVKQIMDDKAFGAAGKEVVVEQFLHGEEASVMLFVSGDKYSIMAPAQDHKRIFDNDEGPNTGGMGAYAPAPVATTAVLKKVEERIIKPMLAGLAKEGIVYKGVLYAGLMITQEGDPYVIEFNCRFGDPETEVVLPLLKTDLIDIVNAVISGQLDKQPVEWYNNAAVSVVLASGGYPGDYEKGKSIAGLEIVAKLKDVTVFHAGTVLQDGKILTAGGRVLAVTGLGGSIPEAIKVAYATVKKIKFDGMQYRSDIAKKALNRTPSPLSSPSRGEDEK